MRALNTVQREVCAQTAKVLGANKHSGSGRSVDLKKRWKVERCDIKAHSRAHGGFFNHVSVCIMNVVTYVVKRMKVEYIPPLDKYCLASQIRRQNTAKNSLSCIAPSK